MEAQKIKYNDIVDEVEAKENHLNVKITKQTIVNGDNPGILEKKIMVMVKLEAND